MLIGNLLLGQDGEISFKDGTAFGDEYNHILEVHVFQADQVEETIKMAFIFHGNGTMTAVAAKNYEDVCGLPLPTNRIRTLGTRVILQSEDSIADDTISGKWGLDVKFHKGITYLDAFKA